MSKFTEIIDAENREQAKLEEMIASANFAEANLRDLEKRIAESLEKYNNTNQDIANATDELLEKNASIAEINLEIALIKSDRDAEVSAKNKELDILVATLLGTKQDIAKEQVKLERSKEYSAKELASIASKIESQQAKLDEMNNILEAKVSRSMSLDNDIAAKSRQIEELDLAIDAKTIKANDASKHLLDLDNKLEELNAKYADQLASFNASKEDEAKLKAELETEARALKDMTFQRMSILKKGEWLTEKEAAVKERFRQAGEYYEEFPEFNIEYVNKTE